jgi:hypothetical protein
MSATQRVTSDKKQIPAHYVQLSSYGCNARGRPATPEYLLLHSAWSSRKLGGWKLMSTPSDQRGPIYVDPKEAEHFLRVCAGDAASEVKATKRDALQSSEILEAIVAFLGSITTNQHTLIAAVERLAIAAEMVAAHPLARMDDIAICEPSSSSNGFHS